MVEINSLAGGNNHEHPFPLSIFGAWMLAEGIERYVDLTEALYEHECEDADYRDLRTCTAQRVCEKLREWAVEVDPRCLARTIESLDELLERIASEKKRFRRLARAEAEERARW